VQYLKNISNKIKKKRHQIILNYNIFII